MFGFQESLGPAGLPGSERTGFYSIPLVGVGALEKGLADNHKLYRCILWKHPTCGAVVPLRFAGARDLAVDASEGSLAGGGAAGPMRDEGMLQDAAWFPNSSDPGSGSISLWTSFKTFLRLGRSHVKVTLSLLPYWIALTPESSTCF